MCDNPVDLVQDAFSSVGDSLESLGGAVVDGVQDIGELHVDAAKTISGYNFHKDMGDKIGDELGRGLDSVGKDLQRLNKKLFGGLGDAMGGGQNLPPAKTPDSAAKTYSEQQTQVNKMYQRRRGNSGGGTVLTSPLGASSMTTGQTNLGA